MNKYVAQKKNIIKSRTRSLFSETYNEQNFNIIISKRKKENTSQLSDRSLEQCLTGIQKCYNYQNIQNLKPRQLDDNQNQKIQKQNFLKSLIQKLKVKDQIPENLRKVVHKKIYDFEKSNSPDQKIYSINQIHLNQIQHQNQQNINDPKNKYKTSKNFYKINDQYKKKPKTAQFSRYVNTIHQQDAKDNIFFKKNMNTNNENNKNININNQNQDNSPFDQQQQTSLGKISSGYISTNEIQQQQRKYSEQSIQDQSQQDEQEQDQVNFFKPVYQTKNYRSQTYEGQQNQQDYYQQNQYEQNLHSMQNFQTLSQMDYINQYNIGLNLQQIQNDYQDDKKYQSQTPFQRIISTRNSDRSSKNILKKKFSFKQSIQQDTAKKLYILDSQKGLLQNFNNQHYNKDLGIKINRPQRSQRSQSLQNYLYSIHRNKQNMSPNLQNLLTPQNYESNKQNIDILKTCLKSQQIQFQNNDNFEKYQAKQTYENENYNVTQFKLNSDSDHKQQEIYENLQYQLYRHQKLPQQLKKRLNYNSNKKLKNNENIDKLDLYKLQKFQNQQQNVQNNIIQQFNSNQDNIQQNEINTEKLQQQVQNHNFQQIDQTESNKEQENEEPEYKKSQLSDKLTTSVMSYKVNQLKNFSSKGIQISQQFAQYDPIHIDKVKDSQIIQNLSLNFSQTFQNNRNNSQFNINQNNKLRNSQNFDSQETQKLLKNINSLNQIQNSKQDLHYSRIFKPQNKQETNNMCKNNQEKAINYKQLYSTHKQTVKNLKLLEELLHQENGKIEKKNSNQKQRDIAKNQNEKNIVQDENKFWNPIYNGQNILYERSNSVDIAKQSMTMPIQPSQQLLSKDTEQYIRKTEMEQKKLHSLKKAQQELKKETDQRRDNCKYMARQLDASIHRINNVQNQSLIKQKEHFLKKNGDINEKIKQLQNEIDLLRKSRKNHVKQIDDGLKLIQNKRQKYEQMSKIVEQRKNLSEQQQEQIYELNLRNEDEKIDYQNRFDEIAQSIENEKRESEFLSSQFSLEQSDVELAGSFDTASVLKQRLQKLIIKNKEKVKMMDTYMRNLTIIDICFNQIKESTGITDIKEIQDTFIKSQEQNRSLLQYLDLLNQQIDHLNDHNIEINQKIEKQQLENTEKRQQLSSTPTDVTNQRAIKKIILKKQQYVNEFNDLLGQIAPSLLDQLRSYSKGVFNTDKIKAVNYEQQSQAYNINVKSIEHYLSDLQEFSNKLIEYQAHKAKLPLISILDLDNVSMKQFQQEVQKQININAQNMATISGEDRQLLDRNTLEQFAKDHITRKINNSEINY
ncbi:hypothetical protein PPERSA_12060 [Pseudocohnilembus persalinus]|uniref:Uncharacterized protein n=1 Tax=Pseudocohnilembus persalinus TaxID=266149 RepID=A0A0V0R9P0_PSEPJ|nr:hypothetical protein PPERSA_12060 [Pseudocohnilembus persalinus]|eukprot:KRX10936.1 hypothetical protein PPERSA_12060 [Pseudocohnilembus persalinus]